MIKFRKWLIRKIVGNMPVIMNVTISSESDVNIRGAQPEGLFERWVVLNDGTTNQDA